MKGQPRQNVPDTSRRRFLVIQSAILIAFAVVLVATRLAILRIEDQVSRSLLVIGPLALLIVWAWEFFKVVRGDDEMMQAIQLRAISISAMLVLLAGTMWGVFEKLMGAPQFPSFLLLPAFALVYGISWMILSDRG